MKWFKELRGWLAWRPVLAEYGLEIRNGLCQSLMELRAENNKLRQDYAELDALLHEPGTLVEKLREGYPEIDWNHWGVKHLLMSIEDTIGLTNGIALEIGMPGTERHYEVQITRPKGKSLRQALEEQYQLIEGLLEIITRHYIGCHDHRKLTEITHFDLVFTTNERIILKRALQRLEDKKCFDEHHGSSSSSTTTDSASTS
jgi:hypothetical protein